MPCYVRKTPEGFGFICGRRLPRMPPCQVCRVATSEVLCDGREPGKPGTCDAKLCRSCAVHHDVGQEGTDFFPRHKDQAPPAEQMGLAL